MSRISRFVTFWLLSVISGASSEASVDVVYKFGDKTANLTCYSPLNETGYTFKKWYYDGDELVLSGRYSVENNVTASSSVLTITKPTREDTGRYIASFSKSATESNCTVEFVAPPLVLDMAKSKNLDKGEDLDLHCEVKGYPESVVTWVRDGLELNMNASRVRLTDDDIVKNAHLYITSLEYSDEGVYKCTAYSKHFNSSHSKSLLVRVNNPIAWVWPLIGIIVEVIFLAIIIFACAKFDKRRMIRAEQNDLYRNEGHGTRNHGADKTE